MHKNTEGVVNTLLLKAGVRGTKRTCDAAAWNVNLRDMRFGIFQYYLTFDRALRFKNLWISSV